MRSTPDLPFAAAEFHARWSRVREGMAVRGLETLIVATPENIFYLSGYSTPAYYSTQALVLPLDREPFLLVYAADVGTVRSASCVSEFAAYGPSDEPMAVLAAALRERRLATPRLGLEMQSWFFSVALYQGLAAALGFAPRDGSEIVERCRAIKSESEIAYIRAGARIANSSMQAVMDTIRSGVNENELAAAAYAAAIRAGSTYPGSPPYVSSGPRARVQHATWSDRTVRPGDEVFVELSGCVQRYSAALMRTFLAGDRPDDLMLRLEEAIIGGLNAAIDALRPGAHAGDVDAACRRVIAAAGFGYPHETGYSIGICYPPGWNETHIFNLKPDDQRIVQPNMVIHFVPHIIQPAGTVGMSETVLVTESGPEVLTDFPRRLILC